MRFALILASVLLIAAPTVHGGSRGPISIAEFEAHTSERFAAIDADGDERISSDEFNAADVRPPRFMRRGHHSHSRGDGRGGKPDKAAMKERLFSRLDADEDGYVSQVEFNEPIERLRALDANGDGQVDRDERRSGLRKRGHG
ncbi:MAG: hypothetical protein F4171_14005 [Gammaproteobacteria bacterium]|nr:hypothetical protein [Gammaproteobacteria bacterium]MYG13884.1 hypothetical protein [Gammaproteobacteria bacterium]